MDSRKLASLRKRVVHWGDVKALEQLLMEKPDVLTEKDNTDRTLLIHAAMRAQDGVVGFILAQEDKVDVNVKGQGGRAAITEGVLADSLLVVEQLHKAGANLNTQDNNGKTPLMYAAENGSFLMVKALLDNGARVDIQANDHRCAKDFAKTPELKMYLLGVEDTIRRRQVTFTAQREGDKVVIRMHRRGEELSRN